MTKKDFTTPLQAAIAEATAAVDDTQEAQEPAEVEEVQEVQNAQKKPKNHKKQPKPRKTYTDAEARKILMTMRTNGRKGVKLPRINLAFRPDIYEFATTTAQGAGMSYTAFINMILEKYMNEHIDSYRRALELKEELEQEHSF